MFRIVPVFRVVPMFRGVPVFQGVPGFRGVPVFQGVPLFLVLVHADQKLSDINSIGEQSLTPEGI